MSACRWPSKVAYDTHGAAAAAARALTADKDSPYEAYPCKAGHFHVGTARPGGRKLGRRIHRALRRRD